jgi:cytidylate kinase
MTSVPRVIAIDGAAGSGKSTLARALARALGLPYVNTGLMYRALTRAALDLEVDLDDEDALLDLTRGLRFTLRGQDPPELEVEGFPREVLVTGEVDAAVSRASRHPRVRARMREDQRALGVAGAVMEGRDIGSVVFPDAPVKLFLRADEHARGSRRAGDRDAPRSEVTAALRARDERDAQVQPHEPTPDAVTIDTTDRDAAATLEVAVRVVRDRLP